MRRLAFARVATTRVLGVGRASCCMVSVSGRLGAKQEAQGGVQAEGLREAQAQVPCSEE